MHGTRKVHLAEALWPALDTNIRRVLERGTERQIPIVRGVCCGTAVALVTADGSARQVADEIAFPNGMAITPDGSTLIVAESYASKLTAFDISAQGDLTNRRVWAHLDGPPDGICLDAEGAAWSGAGKRCLRLGEGGDVLQAIELDRYCFACMLGGPHGTTLFIMAAEFGGTEKIGQGPRTGQVLTVDAPAPGAGWPKGAGARHPLRLPFVRGIRRRQRRRDRCVARPHAFR